MDEAKHINLQHIIASLKCEYTDTQKSVVYATVLVCPPHFSVYHLILYACV